MMYLVSFAIDFELFYTWIVGRPNGFDVCFSVFAPLVSLIGHRAVLGLSGYVINNIAFVLAAVYFYR